METRETLDMSFIYSVLIDFLEEIRTELCSFQEAKM